MSPDFQKITDKVREAMINPELNRVRIEVRTALQEMKDRPDKSDLVAGLLERGIKGLRADLGELKIGQDRWQEYETAYERRFKIATTGLEKEAIFSSLEAKKLDVFVNDYAKYTRLDAVIAECKKKDSKEPMKRFVRTLQAAGPLFAGIGAGIMKWLNEGKKTKQDEEAPSALETTATKADEVLGVAEGKKSDRPKTPKRTPKRTSAPSSRSSSRVETAGTARYEINPNNSEKLSPAEFRKRYESIKDQQARNIFVLQQVAAGNASNDFEHLTITGKNGTKLEMDVDKSGLRVAGMEVQLDGPTAMAAAELTGCTLPTPWISDQIYRHAKETGGAVEFIAAPAIAASLGIPWDPDKPDGNWMMSAQFAIRRDQLLREWRASHHVREDQLVAGYFKDIIQPTSTTRPGMLDFYGGKREDGTNIQGAGGNAHSELYADYSHQLRRVRRKVKVNGGAKDISAFYSDPRYAKEFSFTPQTLGQAYAYGPQLRQFVAAQERKRGNSPELIS